MKNPYVVTLASMALAVAIGGVLVYFGVHAVQLYGVALFLGVPFVIGFIVTAVMRFAGPQSLTRCILVTLLTAIILSLGFLFLGWEGIVCIAMAIPLAAAPLVGGALLGHWLLHSRRFDPARSSTFVVLALITVMLAEPYLHREPESWIVTDSVIVDASAADTWSAVVALDTMPASRDWIYRAGVACPLRTRIITPVAGGYRVCTLSTGTLIEQIEVFRPGRTLRWQTKTTPPPMRETNPFHADVDPPHLHGCYESPRGEFALEPIGPHRTRLTRRTWYSQRLYPQWYWNFWCDMAISRIHRSVLDHVRSLSETRRRGVRA